MPNKVISLSEAAQMVSSGDMLALGGLTIYRRPVAFVRALIQRFQRTGEPKELSLYAFTAGLESDLLVGAGMVQQVHTCYFGLEIFGLAPMFTYRANRGEIQIIEETETSLALGLRAAISQLGFLPGRAWQGTDLMTLRPDVKTIQDPYTGEELVAFPAIRPDVAVIHALVADVDGNAQIGKNKGVDEDLPLAAKTVIITAEQIVPALYEAEVVAPFVHAVVHAPAGAAPTSCHPLYGIDGENLLAYAEQVSDPESFQRYLDSLA